VTSWHEAHQYAAEQGDRDDGPPPCPECAKLTRQIETLTEQKAEDDERADSLWAEEHGFTFCDRDVMSLTVGPFEIVLSGDLAECERDSHLSLNWTYHSSTPKISGYYGISDNPSRRAVAKLVASLKCE
jgi:hypothetical protein